MKLLMFKNHYLALTYDSSFHTDGIGAQTERIWNIYSWAQRAGLGYVHTGIDELVEPFANNWQDYEYKRRLIEEVNRRIQLPSTTESAFEVIEIYGKLTRRKTYLKYLSTLVSKRSTLLKVLYVPRPNYNGNFVLHKTNQLKSNSREKLIVAHIRHAEGRYGVPDRRNLNFKYYLKLINRFREDLDNQGITYRVIVLTDIGVEDFHLDISQIPSDKIWIYSLTEEQLKEKKITFRGFDYKNRHFRNDSKVSVLQGGSPMEALEIMEEADYLIMSRSSLSSVGGTLNHSGIVVVPPDWIYAKNRRWVKARKLIKIDKDWRVARHPIIYLFIPHRAMNWVKRVFKFR